MFLLRDKLIKILQRNNVARQVESFCISYFAAFNGEFVRVGSSLLWTITCSCMSWRVASIFLAIKALYHSAKKSRAGLSSWILWYKQHDLKAHVILSSFNLVLVVKPTCSSNYWHNNTTICVQPWSVNVFSRMFIFQTRQFPRQLCRLDQWKCFVWSMKLWMFVKEM